MIVGSWSQGGRQQFVKILRLESNYKNHINSWKILVFLLKEEFDFLNFSYKLTLVNWNWTWLIDYGMLTLSKPKSSFLYYF